MNGSIEQMAEQHRIAWVHVPQMLRQHLRYALINRTGAMAWAGLRIPARLRVGLEAHGRRMRPHRREGHQFREKLSRQNILRRKALENTSIGNEALP